MNIGNRPPSFWDTLGFASRRLPWANRVASFVRRNLVHGLKAGFWEFMRIFLKDIPWVFLPKGTFSAYQSLRWGDPSIVGRIILEDQGAPKVAPASLVVNCGLSQHKEQPWPIVWTRNRSARLVSNSLALFNDKKELCLESVYGAARWRDDPASRALFLPKPKHLQGRWTSIVSEWNPLDIPPIYGHWLHDALPRLAVLGELPLDTKILVPSKLKAIHWETLELMGLKGRCRPTSEVHLTIEDYYFSSPVGMISCFNPYGINFMRQSFCSKAPPDFSAPRKFFYLRTSSHRRLSNIHAILEFLKARGWPIVRDIDLNFAQTVALFSQATDICSFLGSNMSNTMFCSPNCKVLQWVPDIFIDGFTDMIASAVGFKLISVVLASGGPAAHSPSVKIEDLRQSLAEAGYES